MRNPGAASLCIASSGTGRDNMFSTHPATQKRIAMLDKIADEMGLSPPPPVAGKLRTTAVPKSRRSASALDSLGRRN